MGQNLNQAIDISPSSNALTAVYTGWESATYSVPGTPHGAEEINVMLDFDFDGASQIDLLPQHASFEAPTTWYPVMKTNSDDEVVLDEAAMLPANMLSGVDRLDLPFRVPAMSFFRLSAKVTGGTAPTLNAKVTAGGGWRGA